MAMKKVEEKNKKNMKKDKKEVTAKKKEKVVEAVVEEETVVCEECGKKYLVSLKECPKCGYSAQAKKKTFYDDEDDFEDYDDEDEEYVPKKKVKEEPVKVEEVEVKETKKASKKEDKKEEKKVKDSNKKVSVEGKKSLLTDDSNEVLSFIKILVVIVLLVALVWLIAAVVNKEFTDKDGKEEDEEVSATIQNEKILANAIFEKEDKTYYVFAYNGDKDNSWAAYYATLYAEYNNIDDEEKIPMYWVDLSDPLNKDVVADTVEDENTKPNKYEDLSIYSPALIRVKNGKLDKYYDGDYAVDKLTRLIASFKETEEEK